MTVNQNTTERPAHTQHGETAQVEGDAVGINPDPGLAAFSDNVTRDAVRARLTYHKRRSRVPWRIDTVNFNACRLHRAG